MANTIQPIRKSHARLYKLTDANLCTHGGYQWVIGETRETSGTGPLCASGWLHAYSHPDIAILLNPIHADYRPCRLFEAEGSGIYLSDQSLKVGVSRLRLLRELPVPVFSAWERAAWAVFVVRSTPGRTSIPQWEEWADQFLAAGPQAVGAAWAAANAAAAAAAAPDTTFSLLRPHAEFLAWRQSHRQIE